jgi:spore germination protein GerM
VSNFVLQSSFASDKDLIKQSSSAVEEVQSERQDPQSQIMVHLYFSDRLGNYLQAEERSLSSVTHAVEKGRLIVKALIKGPKTDLIRTIPTGTRLNAFYLGPGGRAYVDLSETVMNDSPGGSRSELLTVYSIVNSLILNIPEIKAVKILINGRETPTLAGHIDNRYSFTSDMLLIR